MSTSKFYRPFLLAFLFVMLGSTTALQSVAQSFTPSGVTFGGGFSYQRPVIADFNGDGNLDVFLPGEGPNATAGSDEWAYNEVWFRNDNGSYTAGQTDMGMRSTTAAAAADFDGDGDMDVFAANGFANNNAFTRSTWDENVIWVNQGGAQGGTEGVFVDSWSDGLDGLNADGSQTVKVADLDADGDPDIVLANFGGEARIWQNDGGLNFTSLPFTGVTSSSLALLNVVGDAQKDLVFGNGLVFENTSTTGFVSFSAVASLDLTSCCSTPVGNPISNAITIEPIDFDFDGDEDVIFGDSSDPMNVYENTGGTFAYVGALGGASIRFNINVVDLNGDEYPDVVSSTGATFIGIGDGTFSSGASVVLGPAAHIAVADLDSDLDGDLILGLANPNTSTVLYSDLDPAIVVNTTADSAVASDGLCTIREAISNSENDAELTGGDCATGIVGRDIIEFAIPGVGNPHRIILSTPLPSITKSVIIDGTTQPGTVCGAGIPNRTLQIVLNGAPITAAGNGLTILGSDSEIKGLVINEFNGAGIAIINGDNNTVSCSFIGTDWTGLNPVPNASDGISLSGTATGNMIGGSGPGDGNLISGNSGGVHFEPGADATVLFGNFIGTDKSGTFAIPNTFVGISNNQAAFLQIGGPGEFEGNLISGNSFYGVELSGASATGNRIQGNRIGTDITGTLPIPNAFAGIFIQSDAPLNTIGGTLTGERNTIAFNTGAGIALIGVGSTGNALQGNDIFSNSGLGIDLGTDGVTANDLGDADVGPNQLLNWPDVTAAGITAEGDLVVTYEPTSDPANATYPLSVGLYKADASLEEGGEFIGTYDYLAGGYPNAAEINLGSAAAQGILEGDWIVADASDADLNSSEFGPAIQVAGPPVPQSEIDALTAIYNGTNGADWLDRTNWITDPDPANWYGVTVDNGHVTELYLQFNNLDGTLPSVIGDLTSLVTLQVAGNLLTGSLPDEIGLLTQLLYLNIDNNQFSGNFPGTVGALSNLIEVTASNNLFDGQVPPALFSISTLQSLELASNNFSGDVLTTFSPLPVLSRIWLQDNALSGVPDLSSLPALADLQVQGNYLSIGKLEPNAGVAGFVFAPQLFLDAPSIFVLGLGSSYELGTTTIIGGDDSQFQWLKNGVPIAGATAPTITLSAIQADDAGDYTASVSNPNLPGLIQGKGPITVIVSALVVNTTADENISGNGQCSLREAILTANANIDVTGGDCVAGGGLETIAFDIAGGGPHVIQPTEALPPITEAVVIDGFTQAGSATNTSSFGVSSNAVVMIGLDGAFAPAGTDGLRLESAETTVRGLAITNFSGAGIFVQEGSVFEEFLAEITVGDDAQTESTQVFVGLSSDGSDDYDPGDDIPAPPPPPAGAFDVRMLAGSTDVTTDYRDAQDPDHTWTVQFYVGATDARIAWEIDMFPAAGSLRLRDTAGGDAVEVDMRNVAFATIPAGIQELEIEYVLPVPGSDNAFEGLFIGLGPDGQSPGGNAVDGIVINGGSANRIGGPDLDDFNVISSNTGFGIRLLGDDNIVQNNFVGVSKNAFSARPNSAGVFIRGNNNTVGGTSIGTGNTISLNAGPGVQIDEDGAPGSTAGNRVLGNRIDENGGLGIDLVHDGLSPGIIDMNDSGDGDNGANGALNHPAILTASFSGQTGTLTGLMESTPGAAFRLEFFASSSCDATGYGEGEYFLGHMDVIADGSGTAEFEKSLSVAGIPGRSVSATATDVAGNTSEFGPCVLPAVNVPSGYIFTEVDGGLDAPQGLAVGGDGTVYVSNVNSGDVFRYDADGNPLDGSPFIFGIQRPIDVAVTRNPKLFVTSLDGGSIYKFDLAITTSPGNDASTMTPWVSGLSGPTHITLGPDGWLYFSEVLTAVGERISRVDPEATSPVVEPVILFPDTDDINPAGIAFDDSGYMYFTTQLRSQVLRFDLASATSLPVNYDETDVLFSGLNNPGGIAIGTDGDLYVATLSDVVTASVESAVMVPFVSGLGGGQFNNVIFDDEGRMYFADGERGNVVQVAAPLRQVQAGGSTTFVIHEDGAPTISDGSDFAAVRAAFQNWTDVPTATVSFVDGGLTPTRLADPNDGVNLVTFSDDEFPFPPFVLAIAAKLIEFNTADEAVIVDADVVYNPEFLDRPLFNFGTDTYPGVFDIESVGTHEVGHVLGMTHSGLPDATMFFALPELQEARSLEIDDIAWISERYPDPATYPALGSISGTVFDGESADPGAVIAGALVIATNVASQESVHAYAELDGSYHIPGLPTANYKVSIQPIDGDVFGFPLVPEAISPNLASISTNRSFLEEFYNGPTDESDDPAVDNASAFTTVAVSGAVSGIDFISNQDLTPPSILSTFPATAATGVPTETAFAVRFSERVIRSSVSIELQQLDDAAPPAIVETFTPESNFEDDDQLVILSLETTMIPGTQYRLDIAGSVSDLRGNLLDPTPEAVSSISFTTENVDTEDPMVASISVGGSTIEDDPGSGTPIVLTDVLPEASVTIFFSESMAPQSLTEPDAVIVSVGGVPITGTVEVDRDLDYAVAQFTPEFPMAEATTFDVRIDGAVQDASGRTMGTAFIRSFQTIAAAPPVLIEYGPADGSTSVSVTTPIVVDFSEGVDAASITTETFVVMGPGDALIPGTYEFLFDETRVVFRPDLDLAFGTSYGIHITSGVTDKTGIALSNPLNSSFQTAVLVVDPQITSVSPLTGVLGSVVYITGDGFDANPSNVQISFNGIAAEIISTNLTSIETTVPLGATSGLVQVTVGGTPSNGLFFEIVEQNSSTDEAVSRITSEKVSRDTELSPDGSRAYITYPATGTVGILDLISSTFQPDIPVGAFPLKIAISPDGTRAYVTNFSDHSVSIIDLSTNTVIDTVPVGLNPTGVAITPDGTRIYVAEFTSKGISIIDGDPSSGGVNKVVARISSEAASRETVIDPDGARVSSESAHRDIEITPDGTRAIATGSGGILVLDINPASEFFNQAVARVSSETPSRDVEISPDGTAAFVTSMAGEILWINIESDSPDPYKVVARVSSEAKARELELSPDGTILYVTTVRLDPVSLEEISAVDVYQVGLSTSETAGGAGIRSGNSNDPVVSTGLALILVETIEVQNEPEAIVLDPRRNTLLVTSSVSTGLTQISFGEDSDLDGLSDAEESDLGTDPDDPDTDDDLTLDGQDAFPLDPTEQKDIDLDGVGDNRDLDDDESTLPDRREVVRIRLAQLENACVFLPGAEIPEKDPKKKGSKDDAPINFSDVLTEALKHVDKSLEAKNWIDVGGMSLHPKDGKRVFEEDKKTLQELDLIAEAGSNCSPVAEELMEELARMDEELARIAISEVTCNGSTECEEHLAKAIEKIEIGRIKLDEEAEFEKAINEFKKAWQESVEASKEAVSLDKGASDDDASTTSEGADGGIPDDFVLDSNYPNPFNPVTTIRFGLPEASDVRLEVFDVLGRRVAVIVDDNLNAGYHVFRFNASNLASGLYLYRMQATDFVQVRKMVILK